MYSSHDLIIQIKRIIFFVGISNAVINSFYCNILRFYIYLYDDENNRTHLVDAGSSVEIDFFQFNFDWLICTENYYGKYN